MDFACMNEIQRRLHNAALVIESEGDDNGFAKLQRDAIAEIATLESVVRDMRAALASASGWLHSAYDAQTLAPQAAALLAQVDAAIDLGA